MPRIPMEEEMAAFSKKHYKLLEEALHNAWKGARPDGGLTWGVEKAANYISLALEKDNPAFNRSHFLDVVSGKRDVNSLPPRR